MNTHSQKILHSTLAHGFVFLCLFLFIAPFAHGEVTYTPLVGLPGFMDKDQRDLPTYINALYLLTIGLGALAGVVRIAIAGVKYSLTDIVTHKGDAKEEIKGVLLGLAVLLVPFIVLNTINPNLTNLDVLHGVKVNISKTGQPTNTTGSAVAPGTVVKECQHRLVAYPPECMMVPEMLRSSDLSCISKATYDASACITECTTLKGTFERGLSSSKCTYKP